jgi:hypothetical protein
VAPVGFTPCGPEVAEDICDFQSGTLHNALPSYFGGSAVAGEQPRNVEKVLT